MYKNGYEFVKDFHDKYGLIEGYNLAIEYLELQKNTTDKEERKFCEEVRIAIEKLDRI